MIVVFDLASRSGLRLAFRLVSPPSALRRLCPGTTRYDFAVVRYFDRITLSLWIFCDPTLYFILAFVRSLALITPFRGGLI